MTKTIVKRKPNNLDNLSFKPVIIAVASDKTGEVLNIENVLDDIYDVALLNQRAVNAKIINDYDKIINALYDDEGKLRATQNTIISEQEGYSYKDIGGKDCSNSLKTLAVPSSLDRIMGASAVTIARQSRKRKEYFKQFIAYLCDEADKPKLSQSERKTISYSNSRQGCVLDYSLTNNNFKTKDTANSTRDVFIYKLKVKKDSINFLFKIPEAYRDYEWYSAPKFIFSEDGSYEVIMSAQYESIRYQISDKYVIGVDPGIKEYITYTVMERNSDKIIETGTLPNHLKEFYESSLRTQREVSSLQEKIKRLENDTNIYGFIKDKHKTRVAHLKKCTAEQRASLSRRRREIAIRAGQFLRNVSVSYDNAFIAIEDVRWVGNTMQNGRWNVGVLFDWVSHELSLAGGMADYVSSYYNSQTCHKCGATIKMGICSYTHHDRLFHCDNCNDSWDRDVNASINIAKRGVNRSAGLINYQLKNNFEKQTGVKLFKRVKNSYYSDKRFGGDRKERFAKNDRSKHEETITRAKARLKRARIKFEPPIIKNKEVNRAFLTILNPGQFVLGTNGCGRASNNINSENNSVKVLLSKNSAIFSKSQQK